MFNHLGGFNTFRAESMMSLLSEKTPKEPQTVMKGRSKVEIHGSTPETFTDLVVIAKRDSQENREYQTFKGRLSFFFFHLWNRNEFDQFLIKCMWLFCGLNCKQ